MADLELNTRQLAERFGVSRTRLTRWRKEKLIVPRKEKNTLYYSIKRVRELIYS